MASELAQVTEIHGSPLLMAGTGLAPLRISQLRVRLRARERLVLDHATPGNVVRGALGAAFRRLCCFRPEDCHDRCAGGDECPYGRVFEPTPPPGAERLSLNRDIPRPFVVRFPGAAPLDVPAGGTLEFELVLIGKAIHDFPYFVVTLVELGAHGLGRYRGSFDLESIHDGASTVYQAGTVRPIAGELVAPWTVGRRLTLDFLTPTMLKEGGEVLRRPRFGALIKRVRDRANALSTFFGEGPFDIPFRALGERADRVVCVADQTRWSGVQRYSFRRSAWHELAGFVGRATFEGDLGEFGPWLALGEAIHAGKHAAFGNGRYARA